MRFLLSISILVILGACATKDKKFADFRQDPPAHSRIYFYRMPTDHWYEFDGVKTVYLDQDVVKNIYPGQVTWIDVDANPHILRIASGVSSREMKIPIEAKDPSIDFVRFKYVSAKSEYQEAESVKEIFFPSKTAAIVNVKGPVIQTLFFDLVPSDLAQAEMSGLRVVP